MWLKYLALLSVARFNNLPMERIRACPACGSVDLQWVSGGAFAALDAMGGTGLGLVTCAECGQRVMPIEFESVKALGRFRAQKRKKR